MVGGASAQGQNESTITIYQRSHFKGGSISLSGPMRGIDPVFTAKSVQITGSGAWELCSGLTYSGCKRVDSTVEAGVFTVRSLRPVAPVIRIEPGSPGATGDVANRSLRGVDSEYFVAPTQGTQRIAVPGNNPEQMRNVATEFCRAAGWRQAVHAQIQDAGGTYYLVDVLCANSE